MKAIQEIEIDALPCDNPIPIDYSEIPTLEKEDYELRIQKLRTLMDKHGYNYLIIYGDREHFSQIHYLTGLDPRFEEALLIIGQHSKPVLLLGNEGYAYASLIKADLQIERCQIFSLPGQTIRSKTTLAERFKEIHFENDSKIGIIGWKHYPSHLLKLNMDTFDIPHYIIETLCLYTPIHNLKNAMDLFNDVNYGLKHQLTAKEIIHFELSGTKASRAVYRVLKNLQAGMSEIEASAYFALDGEPLSTHPILSFGDANVSLGLASPSYNRKLENGDLVSVGIGLRGAMVHRAGMYVKNKEGIPKNKRHYVDTFIKPYYASIVKWYEAIQIGNTFGSIYDLVDQSIGIEKFGIALNPGHLIHTDEWSNSPFNPNDSNKIKSGIAIQCDYTVTFQNPYLTAHVEDGIVVADQQLIEEIRKTAPGCYKRIERRREFMKNILNIDLADEILPMSDLSGVCFPYLGDLHTILSAK